MDIACLLIEHKPAFTRLTLNGVPTESQKLRAMFYIKSVTVSTMEEMACSLIVDSKKVRPIRSHQIKFSD